MTQAPGGGRWDSSILRAHRESATSTVPARRMWMRLRTGAYPTRTAVKTYRPERALPWKAPAVSVVPICSSGRLAATTSQSPPARRLRGHGRGPTICGVPSPCASAAGRSPDWIRHKTAAGKARSPVRLAYARRTGLHLRVGRASLRGSQPRGAGEEVLRSRASGGAAYASARRSLSSPMRANWSSARFWRPAGAPLRRYSASQAWRSQEVTAPFSGMGGKARIALHLVTRSPVHPQCARSASISSCLSILLRPGIFFALAMLYSSSRVRSS